MQSAVEVDGVGVAGQWVTKLVSRYPVLLRLLRVVPGERVSESLEATVGRAVERAFAEFAREMRG